jgi:Fe2+ transport system protein FeoA
MLGVEAESWDGLRRWVVERWSEVIDAVKKRLEGVEVGSSFDLEKALKELEGLKSRLDDDKITREVVAPALLLIQAERLGVNEETLKYFAAVVSGAIGGDGYVSATRKEVGLTSGEREIALLWAAALAAYGIKTKVVKAGGAYKVVASGDDAVKLAGLYFLYGPPLLEGDEKVKSHKLVEAMKLGAEGLSVSWEGLRRTEGGRVAAELTISEGDIKIKYNVYLWKRILLQFQSMDQSRVELAARLLKLAGVGAEVKKVKVGGRDVWRVRAATDMLAAGRKELRDALAEVVKKAVENGWVDAGKAEGWLKKLERGRVLKEGWPKYEVGLVEGALRVRYRSINSDDIEREAQRLRKMGLEEGKHFTVKKPEEGGGVGYVRILREGLERAAWLSVYGKDEQQRKLAAEFVEYILQRAWEAGKEVYEKATRIVEEGMSRSSITLEDFEKKVEVNGRTYVVKVKGGEAVEEDRDGRKLLRLKITAEVGCVEGEHIVDRVVREYTITYGRYGKLNAAVGFATARGSAPSDREADAERFSALVEALTGKKPRVYRRSGGRIDVVCGREHLEGFMRYAELADAIKRWLEETGS